MEARMKTEDAGTCAANLPEGEARFVIVGAGAVGSHLAHALASAGAAIAIVDADPAVCAAWERCGIETAAPGMPPQGLAWRAADAVILAVKATVAARALGAVPAHVPAISITNGIVPRADLGPERPLAWGVVDFAADAPAPGEPVCTHPGGLMLEAGGKGAAADAVRRLARALEGSAVPGRLNPDIEGYRWSKLLYNSAFEPVCAVTGHTFGQAFAHAPSRRVLQRLLAEGVAVARAAGIRLQPVHGNSPTTLARVLALPVVAQIASIVGARQAAGVESNMLADLRHGVPSEVDYFNGHVARTASGLGIAAPTHARIVELVRHLEASGEPPAPERALALLAG